MGKIIYEKQRESEVHETPKDTEVGTVHLTPWTGKSSIRLIKRPSKIIAIKYQRPQKGAEPKQVRTIIFRDELNAMISSINKLNKGEPIKTRNLAEGYFQILGIKEDKKGNELFYNNKLKWDILFSCRPMHNKITIILSTLDEMGYIDYRGGMTRILRKDFGVEEVLKIK